jgi:hypothetical protein
MLPANDFPWKLVGPGRPTRETLEARLLPLVRCALRNGTGLPALVGWVHRNLVALESGGLPPDPDRAAPGLTRLLCDVLLRQASSRHRHGAETVCGP